MHVTAHERRLLVNASTDLDVVLRRLDIHGTAQGAVAPCLSTGLAGVAILRARTVRIEDAREFNRLQKGIQIVAASVEITERCTRIVSAPGVGGAVDLMVRDIRSARIGVPR